MRRGASGAAAVFMTAVAAVAIAVQPSPNGSGKTPTDIDSGLQSEVVDLTSVVTSIEVVIEKSFLVNTSKPVTRVQAISPQIAFVQSISPRQILITGVSYGTTQVILWSEDHEQQVFDVRVMLDLEALQASLLDIDPTSNVKASSVLGNILLTGTVSSVQAMQQMEEVAALFVPPDGQIRVQLITSNQAMSEAIRAADPQGSVQAQTIGGRIVLSGTASGPRAARRIVEVVNLFLPDGADEDSIANHIIVTGEHQVLLRVTIAEVSRSATRELGINGFLAGESFGDGFVVNQLGGIASQNIGAAANALATSTIPFLTGSEGIPLPPTVPLSLGFPDLQMQLFLQAMAENTLLRVLAEPNLVAMSGETAGFLAGGEFPVPVPQGVDQITVEYRSFGVSLTFTPTVLDHQMIRLHIVPEVSEIDFSSGVQLQGFAVPGVRLRRAETTVEVGAGQTLAIAGLLDNQVRAFAKRIPGIGDIPVLGALFRSVQYQRNETELVILITPEIVTAMNPNQVSPPLGSGITRPTDFELYGLGRIEGAYSADSNAYLGGWLDSKAALVGSEARVYPSYPELLSIHGPWGHSDPRVVPAGFDG
ncbi:MAG: type II and III secretion system protein family protein [Planctomycetes bacterium]|nr:type II and III secretion system protein family protein [Planctomycetota bacterium]